MFGLAYLMVDSRRRRLGPSLLLLAVAAVLVQENEAFFRRSSFVRLRSGAAQDVNTPLDGTDTDCVPEAVATETMSHEEDAKEAPSKPGWSPGAFFMRLRSGAVQAAEEDSDDDETVTNSTDTLSDEEDTEQVPTKPVWSPGALFDLKNQIIADITEEDEIAVAKTDGTEKEEDKELDDDEEEEEEGDSGLSEEEDETDEEEEEEEAEDIDAEEEQEDVAESSGGGQRGGAMVKEAKARRFQWLAPLETEKVAPSSSRIISDEEPDFDEDEEERDEGIEVQITSDNLYEVEIAADDSEQKEIVEEVALSVEEEEGQPTVVESEDAGTERLEDLSAVNGTSEEQLVSPEDSEKISTDGSPAVALEKDAETGETTTPEMALSVYEPHSPYESSGLVSLLCLGPSFYLFKKNMVLFCSLYAEVECR